MYELDSNYPEVPWLGGEASRLDTENLGEIYFFEGNPPEHQR